MTSKVKNAFNSKLFRRLKRSSMKKKTPQQITLVECLSIPDYSKQLTRPNLPDEQTLAQCKQIVIDSPSKSLSTIELQLQELDSEPNVNANRPQFIPEHIPEMDEFLKSKTATTRMKKKQIRNKIIWRHVGKHATLTSAETAIADGWRFKKKQSKCSYYRCCIARCKASLRIRTVENCIETFFVLEENDCSHYHVAKSRGIVSEAKIYIQGLINKGIDKPKIVYHHIMENVEEKEFVRPTYSQIVNYMKKL